MPKLPVSGRIAAMGGMVVASAAALALAMAGPAAAAGSKLTSCTDQVRVRSQPNTSSPVVGTCKAGEKVTVDENRNGFAHAVNKQGWVSSRYIASGGHPSSHGTGSSAAPASDDTNASDAGAPADDNHSRDSRDSDNVDSPDHGDHSDHAHHDGGDSDSGDSDSGGVLGL